MKIIAISLQKGGTGKTTTAVCLGTALAHKGKRVLILDFDPQGQVALSFGIRPDKLEKTIYDVITECSIREAIIRTEYKGLHIMPSNTSLANFDMFVEKNRKEINPAHWLRDLLKGITSYDYLIIDCPPSLGWLTINALSAATGIIIPMPPEQFALSGLNDLIRTVQNVKGEYNPSLVIYGVLMTLYTARTNLSSNVSQEIQKYCDIHDIGVFDTAIRRSVRIGEAQFVGKPPLYYARGNDAVMDYSAFADEVLEL